MVHTLAQFMFIYSSMYYNVHGLNSGLGHVEKCQMCLGFWTQENAKGLELYVKQFPEKNSCQY